MKIVFLLGAVNDSHIIKRVESFRDKGYEVEVYGFQRDINAKNSFDNIKCHVIGQLKDEQYIGRIQTVRKAVTKVLDSYSKDTLFYVWGYDIACICYFMRRKYIYEISDIVYSYFSNPIKAAFKALDRRIIESSVVTLITSEGFVKFLNCRDEVASSKFILMPNKLSDKFQNLERPAFKPLGEKIKIGFVGYYRYPDTIVRMARVIGERFPDFEFHFWGIGSEKILRNIRQICKNTNNVFEHGSFKNPDDLYKVYESIDVVACNYDYRGANEQIAEPNKLYESLFFNKAIIVSVNTFLAEKVSKQQYGFIVDSLTDEKISDFFNRLTRDEVNRVAEHNSKVSASELIEDYSSIWKLKFN